MKILFIPDVHGKTVWKEALEKYIFDRVIFAGDYVDADRNITDEQIESNLCEIIKLKLKNRNKVTLLLGNHDIQYMFYPSYPCSGFRKTQQESFAALYNSSSELFQVSWQYSNYLFTHAGISNNWYNKYVHLLDSTKNLSDQLNSLYQTGNKDFLFEVGEQRGGFGVGKQHGGPVWADRSETQKSVLPGYHQIVGHSKVPAITRVYIDEKTSFIYCDCLDYKKEFLLLEVE